MAQKRVSDKHEQPRVPPPIESEETRVPNGEADGEPNGADQPAFVSPGDVFDRIDRIRVRQSFDRAKTRRPLATVGIRKPKPHEWFQAHPTFRQECALFLAQEEGLSAEWFFPATEQVLDALEALSAKGIKEVCLFWWINRKKNTFVWPVILRDIDGRQNDWHASMYEMMTEYACGRWCRIEAGDGGYSPETAENEDLPAPEWPEVAKFGDVLRVAFTKGGRVVDNLDHPLLKRLRGEDF
jgi:hypothetical protein